MPFLFAWLSLWVLAWLMKVISFPVAFVLCGGGVGVWIKLLERNQAQNQVEDASAGAHRLLAEVARQIPWAQHDPLSPEYLEGQCQGLFIRVFASSDGSFELFLSPADRSRRFWGRWQHVVWNSYAHRGNPTSLPSYLLSPENQHFVRGHVPLSIEGSSTTIQIRDLSFFMPADLPPFLERVVALGSDMLSMERDEILLAKICALFTNVERPMALRRAGLELGLELYGAPALLLRSMEGLLGQWAQGDPARKQVEELLGLVLRSLETAQLTAPLLQAGHQHRDPWTRLVAARKDPRESIPRLLLLARDVTLGIPVRLEAMELLLEAGCWTDLLPLLDAWLSGYQSPERKSALKIWFQYGLKTAFSITRDAALKRIVDSLCDDLDPREITQLAQEIREGLESRHRVAISTEEFYVLLGMLMSYSSASGLIALLSEFESLGYPPVEPALLGILQQSDIYYMDDEELRLKRMIFAALRTIGTIQAVEVLVEYRDGERGPRGLQKEAGQVILYIQSRLKPTELGGLSLAQAPEQGQLSVAEVGQLSIPVGQLSGAGEAAGGEDES